MNWCIYSFKFWIVTILSTFPRSSRRMVQISQMAECLLSLQSMDVLDVIVSSVHVLTNICPGSSSYHNASSLQRHLVPLSQCLICERSCYRTTLWSFQSFSLDCECEIAVPCSHSVLRIYHSNQFCVFQLTSVYHRMAQQPATAELLLLEICGNDYIFDETFSSNLNVVLWMLVWPPLDSSFLFILI